MSEVIDISPCNLDSSSCFFEPSVSHDALHISLDFPGGSDGKVSVYNVRDLGSIPGLGRFPGEGNGNPL